MKKALISIIFIIFAVVFSGCDEEIVITDQEIEDFGEYSFDDSEMIEEVKKGLDSIIFWRGESESEQDDISRIGVQIMSIIKYKNDGDFDYWQTPEETWNLKTGDCEDIAILTMYVCNKIYGIKPKIVHTFKVTPSGSGFHAVVEHNTVYYDYGNIVEEKKGELEIISSRNYDFTMVLAAKYHTHWY